MQRHDDPQVSAGTADADRTAFLSWAKQSLVPLSMGSAPGISGGLSDLGRIIGDARVVGLTEASHGDREPLEFRNQVFQYLVQEKGFSAIALESGLIESRRVHEYVRGGDGQIDVVLAEGLSWHFDDLPQNRALVSWMREYNAAPQGNRKISFYGFDVAGSPGVGGVGRGADTALTEALAYLARVDKAAAQDFGERLKGVLGRLRFDIFRATPYASGYEAFNELERDGLSAAIADLIALLERREADYAHSSTWRDFEWGYRAALGARQVDAWLRHIPTGWRASNPPIELPCEPYHFLAAANDVRDRGQADNLEWIVREKGTFGKIAIFAHRYHLSSMPVKARWSLSTGPAEGARTVAQAVMGTYLRRRLGADLVTIGILIGHGAMGHADLRALPPRPATSQPTLPEMIEGLAHDTGTAMFLLDLRAAPSSVSKLLGEECSMGQGIDELTLAVGHAFDVLLYIDAVTQVRAS